MKKVLKYVIIIILALFVLGYFYLIYPLWGYPFNAQRKSAFDPCLGPGMLAMGR